MSGFHTSCYSEGTPHGRYLYDSLCLRGQQSTPGKVSHTVMIFSHVQSNWYTMAWHADLRLHHHFSSKCNDPVGVSLGDQCSLDHAEDFSMGQANSQNQGA